MSPILARRLALVCAALALGLAHFSPAFVQPDATGFGDWQMVHHNWEAAFVAATRYGEWPLFDPFHCGGVSIVGNPETQSLSPLFLLSFAVGTTVATKLFVVFHVAAAWLGAYLFARSRLEASAVASTLAGVVFAGSGFFAWHLAGGHATFAPFAFLPWLHLSLARGEYDGRAVVAAACLHALTIAEGGTYPFPYMALSLGLATLVRISAAPDAALRALRSLITPVAIGALLAAYRLVPVGATLARVPRTIGSSDHASVEDVLVMLTARDHDWAFSGHEFVWPEYGTFVGWGALALAVLAVARLPERRRRGDVTTHVVQGLAAIALVMGNASALHPWPLLHSLPVFDSLRVPSRFMVVLTFHLACLGALGLDAMRTARFPRLDKLGALVSFVALVAVGTDIALATRPIVNRWAGAAIDGHDVQPSLYYGLGMDYGGTFASNPRRNASTTLCYVGGMNWPVSPELRVGPVPQVSVERGDGSARLVARSTAAFVVDAELATPGRVVLNVNFDPAFEATRGRVVDEGGRLAVDLPRGVQQVVVRYSPSPFYAGLAISAATAFVLVAWSVRRMRSAESSLPTTATGKPAAEITP